MIIPPRPSPEWLATVPREFLLQMYWQYHPRFMFLKTVAPNGALLDVGCGAGGNFWWIELALPHRTDLKLYGVDLEPGEFTSRYHAAQKADLDKEPVGFPGVQFEGMLATHVLEHLQDPALQVKRLAERLKPGGRIFIEVPTPATKKLPKREELWKQGAHVLVSNFFDDDTHRETMSLAQLAAMGEAAGLEVAASGVISHPLLDDALVWRGVSANDDECLLYGYWGRTGWAHYIILAKPGYGEAR